MILVSNHTSVYDYAVYLFVFFSRTLRFQMAEVLFEKKPLGLFLRALGGIRVNRGQNDLSCLVRSEDILRRGGVVGVFPEGRIPLPHETAPLTFLPGAAFLSLSTSAPILPIYTNGCYFGHRRACVMIGTPINAASLLDPSLSDKENLRHISSVLRDRILELETKLNEQNRT